MADLAVVAAELQAHLIATYKFEVVNKEDSDLMKAIAWGMDVGSKVVSSLPNSHDFMTLFATTIGRTVALPKVMRDNPMSVCEVVTHECQHVIQFADTGVAFAWFYITDNSARAQFEADAYASGLIVHSWLTGRVPTEDLDWVVQNLVRSYHLRPEDAAYAKVALKSLFASWASGIIMTRSARTAVAFLEAKYPELKGTVPA